jgi:mono/diheme cytochrome c family protein
VARVCSRDATRWIGGSLITVTILLALGIAGARAQPLFGPSQDPVAGSRVFGAKGCARCHAVNGIGQNIGPDLGRISRPRSFYDLAAALWNHAPRMADRMRQLGIARPQLDAREAGDIVAFLYTLDYFDPPGDVGVGRKLFSEKRCIACHQVGGVGGVVGPNLDGLKQYDSPIYLAATMWNHGPQMAAAMRAQGIPRPAFKNGELADLIAYVNAASTAPRGGPLVVLPGRPDEGRRLFIEKRCLGCHSVAGQGGKIGPDLVGRGAPQSLTRFAAAMWNKAPAMTAAMASANVPVPQIRPEEMADIVAYLYASRYFAQAGDSRKGVALAAAKGCLGCHGLFGERGKVASDLARSTSLGSPAAVTSALWNHAFIADVRPDRARAPWPEFRSDEMADLVAYLMSLRATPR